MDDGFCRGFGGLCRFDGVRYWRDENRFVEVGLNGRRWVVCLVLLLTELVQAVWKVKLELHSYLSAGISSVQQERRGGYIARVVFIGSG